MARARLLPIAAAVFLVCAGATAIAFVTPHHKARPVAPAQTGSCSQAKSHRTGNCRRSPSVGTRQLTPVLRLSGTTLTWTAISNATSYKLATVHNPTTTRDTAYRVVTGTRFSPPAAPGETVNYGLQANVPHAAWSAEVAITWPATGGQQKGVSNLRVAVMNTTGWGVDSLFARIGVRWTRLDVGDGSDLSVVKKALRDGMKPLVLYNPGPSLRGVSPSTAASQVLSLARKIIPLGLNEIEFGNEVYERESAHTYAAQYAAAHAAVAGMGIKLLAAAVAVRSGLAGYGNPSWIDDFIHALPGGADEVDAWTIHPYGPMTGVLNGSWGWETVTTLRDIAVEAGSSAPWYVTEVGQHLGGSNGVSPARQAADVSQYLTDTVSKYPWIVFLDWYAARDDSTGQFGLLTTDNSPRPAFEALKAWMATSPEVDR